MEIVETPSCRYCLDGSGQLLSPCNCKGSLGYIHLECQKQAYTVSGSYSCPVCLVQFQNVIVNYHEYIEEDEWNTSLCSTCIQYISPILHTLISSGVILIVTSSLSTLSLYTFAVYTILWQVIIGCILLLTNCIYRVKHKERYIHILCTSFKNNYICLHACTLIYLYTVIQYTHGLFYYVILLTSTSLLHIYEIQHIYILRKINEEIDRSDRVLFYRSLNC